MKKSVWRAMASAGASLLVAGLAEAAPAPVRPAMALADEVWTSLGPDGGNVTAVRHAPSDPNVVWALAGSGVFRSDDGGERWAARSFTSSSDFYSGQIDVASDDADRAFTVTADGLRRTDDGGLTWTRLANLPVPVADLVLDASDPERLYALTINRRLFRSEDGGASWRQIRTDVSALAVAPDGTLSLVRQRDVLRSSDAGRSWTLVGTVPAGLANPKLLVIEPGNPQSLWAGHSQQLWQSGNGGRTWRRIGSQLPGFVLSLVHRPDLPRVLYARVFPGGVVKSNDRGTTWTPLVGYGQAANDFSLRPGQANELLVATPDYFSPGGVWRSTNAGASFVPAQAGLAAQTVRTVAVDPLTPGHMFALVGNVGRLYETADNGAHWMLRSDAAPGGVPTTAVAFDHFTAHRVFVSDANGVLRRSNDGGATFAVLPGPAAAGCQNCGTLVIDPNVPDRLFAGGPFTAVYRSGDGGETWAPLLESGGELSWNGLYDVVTVPGDPDRFLLHGWVYCCNPRLPQEQVRLYETTDGGATFTALHEDLPGLYLYSVAYAPGDPSRRLITVADATARWANKLYTRQGDGLWTLVDGGRSWNRLVVGDGHLWADVDGLPAAPTAPPGSAELLVSEDGGFTWSQVGPDLPNGTRVTGEAVILPEVVAGAGGIWVPTSNGVQRLDTAP